MKRAKETAQDKYIAKLISRDITAAPLEDYVNNYSKLLHRCECGNEWLITPNQLLNKKHSGVCPKCALNSRTKARTKTLEAYKAELKEMRAKYEVIGEYKNALTKTLHKCHCGREFTTTPADLLFKKRLTCPKCSKESLAVDMTWTHEIYLNKLKERCKYGTVCLDCFKMWEGKPYIILNSNKGCTKCKSKHYKISAEEQSLREFIEDTYEGDIVYNDRNILNGLELDVYLLDVKVAIELNGAYWHSSELRDKYYHYNKTSKCAEQGIKLLHITDIEWRVKRQQCENIIMPLLCISEFTIDYSSVTVEDIDRVDALKFLESNTLYTECSADKYSGLYYSNTLIGIMAYNILDSEIAEVVLIATKLNDVKLKGILISYIERIVSDVIIKVDRLYGNFNWPLSLGYVVDYEYQPNVLYFKGDDIRRLNKDFDETYLLDSGYRIIYDAGHCIYKKI